MLNINNTFWTENGRNLQKPDLICLKQDHLLYRSLLMQLVGQIEYDNDGIRILDSDLATAKFEKFIEKALEENVDLAVTPEYSCPWTSIDQFISNGQLPSDGKIWVLGCQSIKPRELSEIINNHENITWIYDEQLVSRSINENKFFDPVCLIFKTRDAQNVIRNVIIVQFKTHGFGGNGFEWERDYSIPGNTLYNLENLRPSTRLICIICSDTLQGIDFTSIENDFFKNSPLLIIHIQLNQKPFQGNYKMYRNILYSKGRMEDYDKELICLNWARNVTYFEDDEEKIFNKYGGSGLYAKTNQFNLIDSRINDNHRKGLYYTSWIDKKSNVYFLNYNEAVFLIENTKPSQVNSDPSQIQRSGPIIYKLFDWQNDWVEIHEIDSGFEEICNGFETGQLNLNCLKHNREYVDVERIIQLSCGEIDVFNKEKWNSVSILKSFHVNDSEFNSRNTFTHDPDIGSNDTRKNRMRKYHFLKNILLKDPVQIPNAFSGSELKFDKISDSKNIYLLNIHSPINGRKGTAIYLGDKTHHEAQAFKKKIEGFFNEDHQGKQVIVWYNDPHLNRLFEEDNKPKTNENVSKSPSSFKKTRE